MLPFWGFDQYTKIALEKRDAAAKRDANYVPLASPGAAYSSSRNQRLLQKAGDKHYNKVDDADNEEDFDMNGSDLTKSQEKFK